MEFIKNFEEQIELTQKYGKDKAYLIYAIGLYLDFPDLEQLASEGLTDGNDDKKIDFIRLEDRHLVIAQSYFSDKGIYKAKANKAADLNTAIAWIFSGDIDKIRDSSDEFLISLKDIIVDIRKAIENEEIDDISILYVHNLAESQNVRDELDTVKKHLEKFIDTNIVSVKAIELGIENLEKLYTIKQAAIAVTDKIILNQEIIFEEHGPNWSAGIVSVSGKWLKDLFSNYGDSLFSANYRNFLGISKRGRKKINYGIKTTAEKEPENFWAFNNGITILTNSYYKNNDNQTILEGISIINGAQTTGSIGHSTIPEKKDIKVLARIIKADSLETIDKIIEFNNTQNEITTWDKFSKAPEQKRIYEEFNSMGYSYSFKRGFDNINEDLSIEVVAQPTLALHGDYLNAGSGKNKIFENQRLYEDVFKNSKSKHLLLAFCLVKAIDNKRQELKEKSINNNITTDETKQLSLLKSLRFKYFVLSVIGKTLETIIGEEVDIKNVAFKNGIAGARYNSINDLIIKLKPIIDLLLPAISTKTNENFGEIMSDNQMINKIYDDVKLVTVMLKQINNQIFEEFSSLISPKG
ncbi:MAG: hypothetical protein GXO49_05300 [Chlorobi bacterium]|nr:hypothetical protein [Chlorobiota bacterium]